ncbi:MAG: hypothetical protein FWF90_11340 [Promicromonosporaceae bacterium]|nr:hypothetical protein [Promicromonosporaceae bacterium]
MSIPVPTQQAHPTRASWRTAVQSVLSAILVLGGILPAVASIIGEQLGTLIGQHAVAVIAAAAAAVAAIAAALARIMAIPAVDAWVARLKLSSAPPVIDATTADDVPVITTAAPAPAPDAAATPEA